MAETPKNNIEKLLSDYAETRRKAAGTPRLHPATRRMLQSEVRHCHGSAEAPVTAPETIRWDRLWPRIALACGLCVLLGVVVLVTIPPKEISRDPAMEMARAEKAGAPVDPPTPKALAYDATRDSGTAVVNGPSTPTAVMPGTEPPVVMKGGSLPYVRGSASSTATFAGGRGGSGMRSAPTVTPMAPAKSAAGFTPTEASAPGGINTKDIAGDSQVAGTALTRNAAKPSEPLMPAAEAREGSPAMQTKTGAQAPVLAASQNQMLIQNTTQRFRNIVIANAVTTTNTLAILDEFTVEQSGNELKITDRDGSVYNGYAEAAPLPGEQAGGGIAAAGEANGQMMNVARSTGAGGMGGGGGWRAATAQQAMPVQRLNQAEAQVAGQFPAGPEAQNYNFRVEGTNRSLRARVVVTGNMIQNTFVTSAQNNAVNTYQFRQQSQVQQGPGMNTLNLQSLNNSFINGQVLLGNSRESTEFNALSVDEE